MSRIDELLDNLGPAKYITTLDLKKGTVKFPWQGRIVATLPSQQVQVCISSMRCLSDCRELLPPFSANGLSLGWDG